MGTNKQVNKIWETKTTGKTKKGRPRKTWNGAIVEIRRKRWKETREMAKDRSKWRKWING